MNLDFKDKNGCSVKLGDILKFDFCSDKEYKWEYKIYLQKGYHRVEWMNYDGNFGYYVKNIEDTDWDCGVLLNKNHSKYCEIIK